MRMNVLLVVLTAIYPVLIYAGLSRFEPRVLALLLVVVALLRWRKGRDVITGLGWEGSMAIVLPLAIAVATGINNDEMNLKLYPVAVSLTLLIAFGLTLFKKQTRVERIARMRHPDLPPDQPLEPGSGPPPLRRETPA